MLMTYNEVLGLGGSGGMHPQEIFIPSAITYGAFFKHCVVVLCCVCVCIKLTVHKTKW